MSALSVCSDRHWPVVLVAFPPRLDEAWLRRMESDIDVLFARKERYAMVMDATLVTQIPDAAMRRAIADWSRRIEEPTRRYSVGGAVVITSALVRGALTAVHWLQPPASPTRAVATLFEAFTYVRRRLDAEGIAYPQSVVAYHAAVGRPRATG